jgi:hypothetical protein
MALKWGSYEVLVAYAGGGRYEVADDGRDGCTVYFICGGCETIGKAERRAEAMAIAQAHNDERLEAAQRTLKDGDAVRAR